MEPRPHLSSSCSCATMNDSAQATPTARRAQDEAKALLSLTLPITLVLVLEVVPSVVQGMLIANVIGEDATEALAANSLSDFFQSQVTVNVVSGIGTAVSTLCAQAYGAKQFEQLWIFAQTGLLAGAYCLPVLTVVCACGSWILRHMGQDAELSRLAGQFILIGLVAVPFAIISTVARSALQAQNVAVPFVVVSVISSVISLPLAYVLGYYTSLGYIGVALSPVLGSVIKAAAVFPVLMRNDVFRESWPGWKLREANTLVRRLWRITAGSIVMVVSQSAGFTIVTVLSGFLPNSAVALASGSIATTLVFLAFLPMIGLSISGNVRVGNALGADQSQLASVATRILIVAMLVASAFGALTMAPSAYAFARFYTSDSETINLTGRITLHLLPLVPLAGCVLAAQAIFQACSAQWLCAKLNFAFLFILSVPFSLLFAFTLDGGVIGLWNGQIVSALAFTTVSALWLRRLDWHETAQKVRACADVHTHKAPSFESPMVVSPSIESHELLISPALSTSSLAEADVLLRLR